MYTAYENGTKIATKEGTIFKKATSKEWNHIEHISTSRYTKILLGENLWCAETTRSDMCYASSATNESICKCNVSTISTGCSQRKSATLSDILFIYCSTNAQSNNRSRCSYQSTTVLLITSWFYCTFHLVMLDFHFINESWLLLYYHLVCSLLILNESVLLPLENALYITEDCSCSFVTRRHSL